MKTDEFEPLYRSGGWDGKGSGPGSTEEFTREFRDVLSETLKSLEIRSMFDLGCGDWQWMRHVMWPAGLSYTGWDVAPTAIKEADNALPGFTVECRDAFDDDGWPKADMLFHKDVLHHLEDKQIRRLIDKSRAYPYVLFVTDFPDEMNALPFKWPSDVEFTGRIVHKFNHRAPGYAYGPKLAVLQMNT